MQITVYSESNCPNCTAAKQLLEKEGLAYTELSLDDDSVRADFVEKHPDLRQMPQVFVNGQRVGGLAGLQAFLMVLLRRPQ